MARFVSDPASLPLQPPNRLRDIDPALVDRLADDRAGDPGLLARNVPDRIEVLHAAYPARDDHVRARPASELGRADRVGAGEHPVPSNVRVDEGLHAGLTQPAGRGEDI